MTPKNKNLTHPKTIAIFLTLLCCSQAISQKCQQPTNLSSNLPPCPQNSQCNSSGQCICNKGYFGDCSTFGQSLSSQPHQYSITQNSSYFIIEPSVNEFVSFQFILCNPQGEKNVQLLNLWVDDGSLVTPTERNALGNDKVINVEEGCLALVTSFFSFKLQPNGEKELLLFGIRMQNQGSVKIRLSVQQVELFGFDIIFRIILILVGGIILISLGAVIYCVYKCRRRRSAYLTEQKNDISFFDQYMPSQKVNLQQIKQQICSVCLGQFKQNQQIRPTICSHYFHKSCLDEWCVTNLSCPICRSSFQKADLVHQQYLLSGRGSAETNERQLVQNGIINGETDLRQPIV